MELEQRVKTLEYETKILKNEIQRMLLDIQEQILVHYYPSLRAEETTPPEGVVQSIADVRVKRINAAAAAAVVPPLADDPALPVVKKIKLDDVRVVPEPVKLPDQMSVPLPDTASGVDAAMLLKLTDWLGTSTAKTGSERTGRIVALFGKRNLLKPETTALLLQITSLDDIAAPDKVTANDMVAAALRLNDVLGNVPGFEDTLDLIIEETRRG